MLTGRKEDIVPKITSERPERADIPVLRARETGELVVDMRGVNVRYGPRTVRAPDLPARV